MLHCFLWTTASPFLASTLPFEQLSGGRDAFLCWYNDDFNRSLDAVGDAPETFLDTEVLAMNRALCTPRRRAVGNSVSCAVLAFMLLKRPVNPFVVAFDITPCTLWVRGMQKQWKKWHPMFCRKIASVFVMLPDLLEFSRYWTEEPKSAQMYYKTWESTLKVGLWW